MFKIIIISYYILSQPISRKNFGQKISWVYWELSYALRVLQEWEKLILKFNSCKLVFDVLFVLMINKRIVELAVAIVSYVVKTILVVFKYKKRNYEPNMFLWVSTWLMFIHEFSNLALML